MRNEKNYGLRITDEMTVTKSTVYILIVLTCITVAIAGVFAGCNDKKQIQTPVLGPAAGSGPVGGGDTQKITLQSSPIDSQTVVTTEEAIFIITALVENSIGQPMPDGTPVYWRTTFGKLDTTSNTTTNGSAQVTLTLPKGYNGCSWVTALSGDAEAWIKVCVTSEQPTPTPTAPAPTATPAKGFWVNAAATSVPDGTSTTVTATAMSGTTPEAGIPVTFSVSGGGIVNPSGGITNSSGQVTVTFTGNNPNFATTVTATVTATTADGRSASVQITVTNP